MKRFLQIKFILSVFLGLALFLAIAKFHPAATVEQESGQINITWFYFANSSNIVVTLSNNRTDRALPDWTLGWTWQNGEVITEVQNARVNEDGNCSWAETRRPPVSCSTSPEVSGLEEITGMPRTSFTFFILRIEIAVGTELPENLLLPNFGPPQSLVFRDSVSSYICSPLEAEQMVRAQEAIQPATHWDSKCTHEDRSKEWSSVVVPASSLTL